MRRLITVYLPESYIHLLNKLVDMGFYNSRCEAVRVAIRDLLLKHGFLKTKTLIIEKEDENHDGFSCPLCGFRASNLTSLKRHIRSHFGQLDRCPACGWMPESRYMSYRNPVMDHLARGARRDPLHAAWYYVFAERPNPELRELAREAFRKLATGQLMTIEVRL